MIRIKIVDKMGNEKASVEMEEYAKLIYREGYEDGDVITVCAKPFQFYEIKLDETIEKATVYMTQEKWNYTIDFKKHNKSLHPNAFDKSIHYIYVRSVNPGLLLSYNPYDQEDNQGLYPHVSANAQTRGEPAFACTNVIDGLAANTHHGKWPFTSWGIGGRKDACLTLQFGRRVSIKRIVIYLRAQFPHDSWWTQGRIKFSENQTYILEFRKTEKAQIYDFDSIIANQFQLYDFIKANDDSEFPSLSLIEVYGEEIL